MLKNSKIGLEKYFEWEIMYIYIWRIEKSWLTFFGGHLGVRKWPRMGTTKKIKMGS